MKWNTFFLLFLFGFSACTYRQREDELRKKEEVLNKKEQDLNLRETALQLKEDAVLKREQLLDSSAKDTTHIMNPALVGNWTVKMTCTETSCTGSAVGDTKTENWNLSYESNTLIAKASFNNELVRIYTGFYTGNTVELVENRDSSGAGVKMVVRLRMTDGSRMEGQREIIREHCKVIYDLKLEKKDE